MAREKTVRCSGCSRYILPSRMAGHWIISAVEHATKRILNSSYEWAYEQLREHAPGEKVWKFEALWREHVARTVYSKS